MSLWRAQYPGYSLCNKQIHWGSILSSLTEFNVAVNATFHFALHNPNRFDIRVNHLTCYIKYKNNPVAVASVAGGGSPPPKPPKRLDFEAFPYDSSEYDAVLAASPYPGKGASMPAAVTAAAEAAIARLLPASLSSPHALAHAPLPLGEPVGASSTFLPAGAVTDVRIEAKIDPDSDVATAMALDYALGTSIFPCHSFHMLFSAPTFTLSLC